MLDFMADSIRNRNGTNPLRQLELHMYFREREYSSKIRMKAGPQIILRVVKIMSGTHRQLTMGCDVPEKEIRDVIHVSDGEAEMNGC